MAIHDVSIPIHPGMVIYHDNPGVELSLAQSIDRGDTANVSKLTMGVHTGTHVDGPRHFFDDGGGVDGLPLDPMIGPAEVVGLPDVTDGPIDDATLEAAAIPMGVERLLLKTRNSELWDRDEFTRNFVRLDGSGAAFLLDRDISLVGIDYLSIGDPEAHRKLLGAGIVALEGLDLRKINPGLYQLICLPMRLIGTDGAPARVLLADGEAG